MRRWALRFGRILAVILMIAVGLVLLSFAILADSRNTLPDGETLTNLGLVRFACGFFALFLIPFYRRTPLLLIGAGALCAVGVGTDPFVLAIGLTVWLGRAEKRWEWWVFGGGMAAILVSAVRMLLMVRLQADDVREVGMIAIPVLLVLCLCLIVGIGMWSRQRKRTEVAAASADKAQRSADQLAGDLARQREREDLAREVHDTLASRLSAIALQTGSLEDVARKAGDPELDDAMRAVRANATSALGDLRSLLSSLRAGGAQAQSPSAPPAGISDINDLFTDASAAGLSITPYVVLDGFAEAPDGLRRAVIRITQEALTNALRHSSDKAVSVRIEGAPGQGIRLEYRNRYGYGPDEFDDGAGSGLHGVAERARLVGGRAQYSRSNGEFALAVELPWATERTR
ncbi:Signal transduction histidine kinase [Ruaniaceae bacterium KH17]|nr:Signal transduction histidine kinase [Ruaniaceae bacterium KH17]